MSRVLRFYAVGQVTIALFLFGVLTATPASAKPLFVNGTTGNDSVTYAQNNAANPWRTIGRALWGSTSRTSPNANEAARAGDVVTVACGIYSTTGTNSNGFFAIALSPVNNGTPGNPIRIQSPNNQFACIQVRFTSGSGSVIGSHDKSYIEWSGFDLNEVNTPWDPSHGHQSAQVWISGSEAGTTAVGNRVENSRLQGTITSARDGDNYTPFRLHGTSNTHVRNVHIRNVGQTDENSGCILWYFTKNITIEHSQFERCGNGIYMKGDGLPVHSGYYTIRFNRFISNYVHITAFTNANATPANPGLIHQNIFVGGVYAVKINNFGDDRNPNDLKFLNNIMIDQSSWCFEVRTELLPNAGLAFQNNICADGTAGIGTDGSGGLLSLQTTRLHTRNNVYRGIPANAINTLGGNHTLAVLLATFGQESNSVSTSHALFSDADYHNAAGSPALGRGRAAYGIGGPDGTVINAGPYILGNEVIGLSNDVEDVPSQPQNLRILTVPPIM